MTNLTLTDMIEIIFQIAKILLEFSELFVYMVLPILLVYVLIWKNGLRDSEFIRNLSSYAAIQQTDRESNQRKFPENSQKFSKEIESEMNRQIEHPQNHQSD